MAGKRFWFFFGGRLITCSDKNIVKKSRTLRDRVEDLELAVSFRLPPLEVELVVPQLEKGPHLVDMNPGKRSY